MTPSAPKVQRATPADAGSCATTLASAFSDDPIMSFLLGDRGGRPDRQKRLGGFFEHMTTAELAKPHQLLDRTACGNAVALWHEIDTWRASPKESLAGAPSAIRTFGRRLPIAFRLGLMMEKVHPSEPHRHLAYIGVRDGHQGTGLGSALLQSMVDELDEQGIPGYLESTNPRNDPLYHRYGFVSTGAIDLPRGAPVLTAMWRDPR